jgi:hypothetical protein
MDALTRPSVWGRFENFRGAILANGNEENGPDNQPIAAEFVDAGARL